MKDDKFLYQVARYFCDSATADSLAGLVIVVPTRRSGLFLKSYFHQILARKGKPVMMPRFHTMGRLIQDLAQTNMLSRNEQLFLLYQAYCEVIEESENPTQQRDFDRFVFWGDIILNDFNDIDSSLADAAAVFKNLKGFKEIAADYLTPEQKEVVRRLWGDSIYTRNDDDDNFWLHLDSNGNSATKESFIQLWQLLGPLYRRFHGKLCEMGYTTEGYQQRQAVAASKNIITAHRYAFVGFSALTNAEFSVMSNLKSAGNAQFFWDFAILADGMPLSNVMHHFGQLSKALPQPGDFELVAASWPEEIECIAVPSNTAQAKLTGEILSKLFPKESDDTDDDMAERLINTAVVVPDENLLMPMVMSLPDNIAAVNISMRLPYRATSFASLLSAIISMQMRARQIHGEYHFYYEDLERVLAHSHIRAIAGEAADKFLSYVTRNNLFNVAVSDITEMLPQLGYIFRAVKNLGNISQIHEYTTAMITGLEEAFNSISSNHKLIEYRMLDFFRQQLDELYRLTVKYKTEMGESTYFGLFERLLSAKKIDLHGSPLKGVQVMDVLETRALDFDDITVTTVNEKVFPRKYYLRTMIPDSLRRTYGLNTEAHADSAYTYYFYRMISGARRVKLLYDSRSASSGVGEASRFIMQLKHLQSGDKPIRFSSVAMSSAPAEKDSIEVAKVGRVADILHEYKAGGSRFISASALKTYQSCPMQFYLKFIERYSDDKDVNPYLNAADYGTVVHSVMERLYKPWQGKKIDAAVIDSILHSADMISDTVGQVMAEFISSDRVRRGLQPRPLNTEQKILCRVICHFVNNILEAEKKSFCTPSFRYIKAEHIIASPPTWRISPELDINVKIIIDRVDEIAPGILRFIDYKTGSDEAEAKKFEDIFSEHKNMAIFQLLMYCEAYAALVDSKVGIRPQVYNINKVASSGNIPAISVGKQEILDYKEISDRFMPKLREIIGEIFDESIPFRQTEKKGQRYSPCGYCAFSEICGV